MAYDEDIANRFRDALSCYYGITEKRMMGGVCFFHQGNMLGGADIAKDGTRRFMFRVGKQNESIALARPGAEIVELAKGRRMGGMIFVDEAKCGGAALAEWIALAMSFVSALEAKQR
ncbi:MAG: hypothetical protein JJ900_13995 [Rhodospirillales bacterium]|nr:hypothetical protein [Rhodospirillales bacterium]MBO6787955.1 hypothetical protein [Rhodospirillales bacterium]